MKKTFFTIIFCMTLLSCSNRMPAPDDAEGIIRLSREKCQSIQCGHYVMDWKMKYMMRSDTDSYRYTCDFKKMPGDTIFGKAFALSWEGDGWSSHCLYTGNEFVDYDDSVAVIQSCSKWADHLVGIRHNFLFYTPLTEPGCYPVPSENDMADKECSISLSDTVLDGKPCYVIDVLILPEEDADPNLGIRSLRYENILWIDKNDYIPIQYSIAMDILQGQDTLYQYEECRLVEFNPQVDESKLILNAIPEGVTQQDYVPYKVPEPLAVGTRAPEWSLPTLSGDIVRLADLKGKVVLLDFFYKSCAPCCAALPTLQRLHQKYKNQDFVMIGVDPYDDPKKDGMSDFLAKRNVTYTVLFADRKLTEAYRVDVYPTLFFIGRDGKIVKVEKGFRKDMDSTIEEQLLKML